jgi:hypothetical protein
MLRSKGGTYAVYVRAKGEETYTLLAAFDGLHGESKANRTRELFDSLPQSGMDGVADLHLWFSFVRRYADGERIWQNQTTVWTG